MNSLLLRQNRWSRKNIILQVYDDKNVNDWSRNIQPQDYEKRKWCEWRSRNTWASHIFKWREKQDKVLISVIRRTYSVFSIWTWWYKSMWETYGGEVELLERRNKLPRYSQAVLSKVCPSRDQSRSTWKSDTKVDRFPCHISPAPGAQSSDSYKNKQYL